MAAWQRQFKNKILPSKNSASN